MITNLGGIATGAMVDEKTGEYNEESPLYKMRKFGFRALLGWHYLVLFSPLFVMGNLQQSMGPLVQRQFVLYTTLAVVFLVLMILIRFAPGMRKKLIATPCVGVVCVLGFAVTLVTGLPLDLGYQTKICLTVLLGIAEALLMLAWLTIFIGLNTKQTYRTLGMDVITGSIVAILVESLSGPANIVVAACLPLFSMFSFVILKGKYDRQEKSRLGIGEEGLLGEQAAEQDAAAERAAAFSAADDDGVTDTERASGPAPNASKPTVESSLPAMAKRDSPGSYLLMRILPAALFALAFGIVQGGFFADDKQVLLAFNPATFLGVTLAGVITYFTMERFCTHTDVDFTYRLSLGFFMLGIVLLTAIQAVSTADVAGFSGIVLVLADIAVFAGFNLFDFGNMMLCLGIVRLYGHKNDYFVAMGRFAVYLCMSVGYIASYCVVSYGLPIVGYGILTIICCVALIILVITVAISGASSKDDVEFMIANGIGTVGISGPEGSRPCDYCDSDGNCAVQSRATELSREFEAEVTTAAEEASEEQKAADAEAIAGAVAAAGASDEASENAAPGQEPGEGSAGAGSEASRRGRAPWREACEEICRRYQLSKRETQIFMMIAKGRNAEYVSEKLVISIHTAKTHIANIYQKLDVHSNQEVLDLVDAFRADAEDR